MIKWIKNLFSKPVETPIVNPQITDAVTQAPVKKTRAPRKTAVKKVEPTKAPKKKTTTRKTK